MSSLRRALWGLAAAGFLFGVIDAAILLTSDHMQLRGAWTAMALVVGWGFIGVGLFAWSRNPANRVGSLMAATGFGWFVGGLNASDTALLYTLGALFGNFYFATAIHMLLAAPTGHVERRADRNIVASAYVIATVGVLPVLLFADPQRDFDCARCPDNLLQVSDNETVLTVLGSLLNLSAAALLLAVLLSLVRRWRRVSGHERRLYAPLYAAGAVLMVSLIASLVVQSVSRNSDTAEVVWIVSTIPFALVPYVFLFAFVRARMLQGGAVGELIARMGVAPRPGELRDALTRALNDPSLELVYWLPEDERYVDGEGRPYELPPAGDRKTLTRVERDGERIGAIVHDASLRDAQDHVHAVGAAAALVLANERLDAELRAKVAELRRSRERMLRVGLEERRRLERDLHDGAQQRLVSMAIDLRLARARLRDDPGGAERLLDTASGELEAALSELRELARGIHPAVLSDRGLGTALETLARRAPMPVELRRLPDERLPEAVELAAYFVVSEALTNVAKYARASHASVAIERNNGRVVVAVRDDGVGGADPERGTGLRGLADRLAVLEGRLDVESPPGGGTTVTARIPCG
ncbi:MAG TPA: sensor histidine kinase [Thermoleophilaceae bacterium]|nr:sensor histidine kinase [Thermoleophilaceae bacterium]